MKSHSTFLPALVYSRFVLFGALAFGGLAGDLSAQMSSANYKIPRQAFSNSGGAMSSATRRQPVTIAAQSTPIGVGNSANYYNYAGYLYGTCGSSKGDMNHDAIYTGADVVLLLNCTFLGLGNCNVCFADVNCDNILTGADVVLELNKTFLGISAPPWCGPP